MKNLIVNVSRTTRMVSLPENFIAVDGENLQSNLVFKFSDEYVDGQGRLEYICGNIKSYAVLNKLDKEYSIPIENVITKEGKTTMQLVITEGTEEENVPVFKSNVFYLYCNESVNAVGEPPIGYDLWIEQANAKLNLMDAALDAVDNLDITVSKANGVAVVDVTRKDGSIESVSIYDGKDGIVGKDGFSPIATVTQTESGATVSITDVNGTTTANISNGKDGEDGKDGKDGEDYVITQEDYQAIANVVEGDITIPTQLSQLSDDSTHRVVTDTEKTIWNNKSDFSGSYNDLTDKPTIPDVSNFITKDVNDLTYYYTKTEVDGKVSSVYRYRGSVTDYEHLPSTDLTVGDVYNVEDTGDNYAWTGTVWDKLSGTVDLSGKQDKIDSTHKLDADLVDDTNSTNKFVTATDKSNWSGKQDALVSGTTIKTINSTSILGNGNIDTKDLFVCTYGTTAYAEITSALSDGKVPVCFYDNKQYVYVGLSSTNRYTFSSQLFDSQRYISVNSSDSWGGGSNNFEVTANKVTNISNTSTNAQYPSAKAVYDALSSSVLQLTRSEAVVGLDTISSSNKKPIYRRTFSGNTANADYTVMTTLYNKNSINIINCYGYVYGPSAYGGMPLGGFVNGNYYCSLFVHGEELQIYHGPLLRNGTYEITIEFTKNS